MNQTVIVTQTVVTQTAEWTPVTSGMYFVTVKAGNAVGMSPASTNVIISVTSLSEHIEALIFGQGPQADAADRGCAASGVWSGWRPGSTLRVLVASDVSPQQQTAIASAVGELVELTGGALRGEVEHSGTKDPDPGANQIAILRTVSARASCPAGAVGCFQAEQTPEKFFQRVRILLGTDSAELLAHEMGHGFHGLCHVNGTSVSALITSMDFGNQVEPGRLHPADREMIRSIYRSGLVPGATRSGFVAAGLITP